MVFCIKVLSMGLLVGGNMKWVWYLVSEGVVWMVVCRIGLSLLLMCRGLNIELMLKWISCSVFMGSRLVLILGVLFIIMWVWLVCRVKSLVSLRVYCCCRFLSRCDWLSVFWVIKCLLSRFLLVVMVLSVCSCWFLLIVCR